MKMSNWMRLTTLLGTVAATGVLLASGGESEHERRLPQLSNAAWQTECSACHLAFHPGLLPARSWREMMAGLDKHFGENASLDAATAEEITRFLVAHSADSGETRRTRRIAQSMVGAQAPLRITRTPYFLHQHDEISAAVWKRKSIGTPANCGACHPDAAQGDFAEHAVRIPR